MESMRKVILLLPLQLLLTLLFCRATPLPPTPAVDGQGDRYPYLILSIHGRIEKVDTHGIETINLVNDGGRITSIDYHFRLGYIYWSKYYPSAIKRARLDGTEITDVVTRGIGSPAAVAVDWIEDILYWTDLKLKRIESIHLMTHERRVVIELKTESPLALVIHPKPFNRLYWADRDRRSLSTVYTNGSERTDLFSSACPEALTMDYNTQRVYFWDTCRRDIRYLEGGTARDLNLHTITSNERVQYDPSLVRDLAFMGKTIYVAEASNAIISANITSGEVKTIISSRDLFESIAVVHPQKQMTETGLLGILQCSEPCEHGFCQSGHCVCFQGWTGFTCNEDIDECQVRGNSGCEQGCSNREGSFSCLCTLEGFVLGSDGRSCEDMDPNRLPDTSPTTAQQTLRLQTTVAEITRLQEPSRTTAGLFSPKPTRTSTATVTTAPSSTMIFIETPSSTMISITTTIEQTGSISPTTTSAATTIKHTASVSHRPTVQTSSVYQTQDFSPTRNTVLPASPGLPMDALNEYADEERPYVAIIAGAAVAGGVVIVVVVAVIYFALLCYKFNNQHGMYSPRKFEKQFNPSRASFRRTLVDTSSNSNSSNSSDDVTPHLALSLSSQSIGETRSFTWREM